jgi:hypothetical protein
MKKPHEETWEYEQRIGRVVAHVADDDGSSLAQYRLDVAGSNDVGRLAAQAPAMARALLSLEWSTGRDGVPRCPSCLQIQPGWSTTMDINQPKMVGHKTDCELVAVLRAAGV